MKFEDEWGTHEHRVSQPGRAYDPRLPITCKACINRLDTVLNAWLDKLTKKHKLSESFWVGYKFPWST